MPSIEQLHATIYFDGGIEVGRTITRTPICECTEAELVQMLRDGIPRYLEEVRGMIMQSSSAPSQFPGTPPLFPAKTLP